MAESFNCATSNLLCSENKECDDADGFRFSTFLDDRNLNSDHKCPSSDNGGSEFLTCFLVQSEETVRVMVEREREHLPRDDYLKRLRSGDLDLSVRRDALDWIWKAHTYYGFGPLSFCLSVNYLDRFLSVFELPRGKGWPVQLLAVACLSIAAKMEEIKMPHSVDLQVGDPKFVFEAKSIQRMELLVLRSLRWKMHALTPCSFIDYFLGKTNCEQQHQAKSSISRSVQLILSIIRGIDFLEFKPSEIAAAVAISVSRELQVEEIDKAITGCFIVEKERILKCVELIRDLSLINVAANLGSKFAPLVPQSPVGVLDAGCLSSRSDELTVGSCPNSSHDSPNTKRSKSGGPCNGTSES
ncbi:cyclin-D4-1-like [Gastrolobium bilobum]|uniref:cyclin-D4-1-like n=1 Tax=Gastrolobium bilobum TaxID=150636 RepID=UPI002AB17594|nr:cyclin-D4-1-like [Gastrolobium bilobum]